MANVSEELKLAKMKYESVLREKQLLEDRRNSLVKVLAETMKRSKVLTTRLRK